MRMVERTTRGRTRHVAKHRLGKKDTTIYERTSQKYERVIYMSIRTQNTNLFEKRYTFKIFYYAKIRLSYDKYISTLWSLLKYTFFCKVFWKPLGTQQIGQKVYQKICADNPKICGSDLQVDTHPKFEKRYTFRIFITQKSGCV